MNVVGGQLDLEDPAVGALTNLAAEPCKRAGLPVCAATVVGPRTAVTAAHCITDPPDYYALLFASEADLGEGPVGLGLDGMLFPVASAELHPAYGDDAAWDVAVLRFSEDLPPIPIPISDGTEATDPELLAASARVVGYGHSEGGADYRKRTGGVVITSLSDVQLDYEPGPAMTCDGDSGGPVLAVVDGTERLVAITSRGDPDCAIYGRGVRSSAVHDFLVEP